MLPLSFKDQFGRHLLWAVRMLLLPLLPLWVSGKMLQLPWGHLIHANIVVQGGLAGKAHGFSFPELSLVYLWCK